jgi:hypothetical protein
MYRSKRIAAAGSLLISGEGAELGLVNVNKGATSAVLTLYNNTSAAGEVIAIIDASEKACHAYGSNWSRGIFAVLSGGDADCTISHT